MDYLEAEIGEGGVIRVTTPGVNRGDRVSLATRPAIRNADKGWWSDLKEAFSKADALDFPRRTHEEIIRDLHELRG